MNIAIIESLENTILEKNDFIQKNWKKFRIFSFDHSHLTDQNIKNIKNEYSGISCYFCSLHCKKKL
jgi:hypothetical protein